MILTAIDITKIADKLNQLSYEKAREDLIVQTAKMYYMAQNTSEQIRLTDDNIKRLVSGIPSFWRIRFSLIRIIWSTASAV